MSFPCHVMSQMLIQMSSSSSFERESLIAEDKVLSTFFNYKKAAQCNPSTSKKYFYKFKVVAVIDRPNITDRKVTMIARSLAQVSDHNILAIKL